MRHTVQAGIFLLWFSVAAVSSQPSQAEAPKRPIDRAVEEFKIRTRELGLRPDSPRRAGEAPGPRPQWHGRVFYNARNDAFDAVPHEVRQSGGDERALRRHQFGFNISGPVVIPRLYAGTGRTFFSFSYEGLREKIDRSFLRTIARSEEKLGDWSETVDSAGNPLPIYDPDTTRSNPNYDPTQPVTAENLQYLRDPFPGNHIPDDRIDPVSRNALAYYPDPNVAIGPFFRNNYFVLCQETNTANGVIVKVDHTLRARHRLSVGGTYSDGFAGAARWFPSVANPGPTDRDFATRRGSAEYVFTVSPATVNTVTFEAVREGSESGTPEERDLAAELGLTGVSGAAFPVFDVRADYLDMGRSYPLSKNYRNVYTLSEGLSLRQGRHNLRFWGEHTRRQVNTLWPQYPAGRFRFSSGLTSLPGIVNTGHGFASFLLGLSEFSEVTLTESPSYFRQTTTEVEASDRYELSRGLTLSGAVGLVRWTARTEKYDQQSTIDLGADNPASPKPGALVAAARDGYGRAFQPNRTHAYVRLGVSWSPGSDTKTVVRVSYSRRHGGVPVYFGQWGVQGFAGTPTYVSPNIQLEPALRLEEGVPPPEYPLPDLRPEAVNDTVADLVEPEGIHPLYQSASLVVERQMPASIVLSAGIYRSAGKDVLAGNRAVNPNAIHLDYLAYRDTLNDEAFNRSLRPYPQYLRFDVYDSFAAAAYNRDATYLRLEKRASQGLTVSAAYEFSKQMDDYSGPYGTQDFFNRRNEWSLTSYNRPHTFSLNYSYDLPVGPSQPLLSYSDWRGHILGGWSVSGGTTWYSGDPIAPAPQFNNTGGVVQALRVNVVPAVDPTVSDPGPELWFNPAAFDQPPDFSIGDGPRTHPTLRNPSAQNHDLSVRKRFQLSPERVVEFSAVGLNFVNHANWNDPDAVIGPESAPNVNAGRIIGSRGGRIVQFGLRFSF